jgi:putative RNA 2'-phosphotransferase
MDVTEVSKFIALILRHKPEAIGITLDSHGWADVNVLCEGVGIDWCTLKFIVDTDGKQRYSFNEDMTKIRANQGHSIPVDIGLKELTPPDVLYHGTATKSVGSIMEEGILALSRLYVHLSKDVETATKVGSRHGEPIVLTVDTKAMVEAGYKFFLSENGVWLTKFVPKEFVSLYCKN